MKENKVTNPYRIKKPKDGVLLKVLYGLAGYRMAETRSGTCFLTKESLWLKPEITIPIASIENIHVEPDYIWITIDYYHALKNESFTISINGLGFFGVSPQKTRLLFEKLEEVRKQAGTLDEYMFGAHNKESNVALGCEISGDPDAKLITLGFYHCFELPLLGGMYGEKYKERYLSKKYAIRECLKTNMLSSVFGNLGIPGIYQAPKMMWRNIEALKDIHGLSQREAVHLLIISNFIPIMTIILIVSIILL